MSPIRILAGLLIASLILAAEFVAYWHFGFDEKWIGIVLCAIVAGAGGVLMEIETRKALRPFWKRACTGFRWRRRFPDSPKTEIREFLELFVDAFAFRRRRRCCFLPDDRVMDVYRALYPPGSAVYGVELEKLRKLLRKRYGVDVATSWRDDATLGQIYEQTHRPA